MHCSRENAQYGICAVLMVKWLNSLITCSFIKGWTTKPHNIAFAIPSTCKHCPHIVHFTRINSIIQTGTSKSYTTVTKEHCKVEDSSLSTWRTLYGMASQTSQICLQKLMSFLTILLHTALQILSNYKYRSMHISCTLEYVNSNGVAKQGTMVHNKPSLAELTQCWTRSDRTWRLRHHHKCK